MNHDNDLAFLPQPPVLLGDGKTIGIDMYSVDLNNNPYDRLMGPVTELYVEDVTGKLYKILHKHLASQTLLSIVGNDALKLNAILDQSDDWILYDPQNKNVTLLADKILQRESSYLSAKGFGKKSDTIKTIVAIPSYYHGVVPFVSEIDTKFEQVRNKLDISADPTEHQTAKEEATQNAKYISKEQEIDLIAAIKGGDLSRQSELIDAYKYFVKKIVSEYRNRLSKSHKKKIDKQDLEQEGAIGLLKTINKRDPARGRFLTYAVRYIKRFIIEYIKEHNTLLDVYYRIKNNADKVLKAKNRFFGEHGREPYVQELSELLPDLGEWLINHILDYLSGVQVDGEIIFSGEDKDDDFAEHSNKEIKTKLLKELDKIQDPIDKNITYNESLKKEIQRSLNTLSDRQKQVVELYFGIGVEHPMSLEDIGEQFDLTRERVRQVKDKAIAKLRNTSRSRNLRSYLGQ